jgi:tetratricopeptide (TPR) repeat protein
MSGKVPSIHPQNRPLFGAPKPSGCLPIAVSFVLGASTIFATRASPDPSQAVISLLARARHEFNCCRFAESIGVCDKILRLQSNSAAAHALRAMCRERQCNLGTLGGSRDPLDSYKYRKELRLAEVIAQKSAVDCDILGFALLQIGVTDKGLKFLNQALESEPANAQFLVDRAGAWRQLNRPDQAWKDCERAMAIDQSTAIGERASLRARRGDFRRALEDCNQLVARDPCAQNHFQRGTVLASLNRLKEAATDYSAAIKLEPNLFFYFRRAQTLFELGKIKEALADLRVCTKLNPHFLAPHLLKAKCLFYQQNPRAALLELSAMHEAHDAMGTWSRLATPPECYVTIGGGDLRDYWLLRYACFQALGDSEICREILSTFARQQHGDLRKTTDFQNLMERAKSMSRREKETSNTSDKTLLAQTKAELCLLGLSMDTNYSLEQPIDAVSRALEKNPKLYDAYIQRAQFYLQNNQPQQALQDLKEAEKLNPTWVPAYFHAGTVHKNLKLYKEACEDYSKILSRQDLSGENFSIALKLRSKAFLLAADLPAALKDANDAVDNDPYDRTAYGVRAEAYAKKGDLQNALTDLNQALDSFVVTDTMSMNDRREVSSLHILRASVYDRLGKKELADRDRKKSGAVNQTLYDALPFQATLELSKRQRKR